MQNPWTAVLNMKQSCKYFAKFFNPRVTIAHKSNNAVKLFIYRLPKVELPVTPITFLLPALFSFASPLMQMDCRCCLQSFSKCIPHKSINHGIPSCQVMDTSAPKWTREERKKKSFTVRNTVENTGAHSILIRKVPIVIISTPSCQIGKFHIRGTG